MKDLMSLIFRGIQSEYEAIQIYSEVANEAIGLGNTEVADVFNEIARDEMQHIGNLEELLKKFLPDVYIEFAHKREEGHKETSKDLVETASVTDYIECLKKFIDTKDLIVASDHKAGTTTVSVNKSSLAYPLNVLQELQKVRNSSEGIQYNKDTITICVHG